MMDYFTDQIIYFLITPHQFISYFFYAVVYSPSHDLSRDYGLGGIRYEELLKCYGWKSECKGVRVKLVKTNALLFIDVQHLITFYVPLAMSLTDIRYKDH